jgi:hypothetical protein
MRWKATAARQPVDFLATFGPTVDLKTISVWLQIARPGIRDILVSNRRIEESGALIAIRQRIPAGSTTKPLCYGRNSTKKYRLRALNPYCQRPSMGPH